jgi:hypothetical protein
LLPQLDKQKSQSCQSSHDIVEESEKKTGIWVCSCPDHKFRGVECEHIFAVEISFALRKEVEVARIEPLQINCCIFCNSSNIVKDGLRHNKRGDIQKYECRDCIAISQLIWDLKECAPLLKS